MKSLKNSLQSVTGVARLLSFESHELGGNIVNSHIFHHQVKHMVAALFTAWLNAFTLSCIVATPGL